MVTESSVGLWILETTRLGFCRQEQSSCTEYTSRREVIQISRQNTGARIWKLFRSQYLAVRKYVQYCTVSTAGTLDSLLFCLATHPGTARTKAPDSSALVQRESARRRRELNHPGSATTLRIITPTSTSTSTSTPLLLTRPPALLSLFETRIHHPSSQLHQRAIFIIL
jgi:hypothetical protein